MPKKSKLFTALDAYQGGHDDPKHQKKLQKQARKRLSMDRQTATRHNEQVSQASISVQNPSSLSELRDRESDNSILEEGQGADAIPFSDLESLSAEDKDDIVPHQRLTINNFTALMKAHRTISSPHPLLFQVHQSVTSATQTEVEDVNDDLNRELAFYKQALDAAVEARQLLFKEGLPFSRPNDFFAEMVKSDEHMDKIKSKMIEDEANNRAAAEAKRQRNLKKFGKQVQIARLQERDKAKRDTLDKINSLKRKRKGAAIDDAQEDDLFDVTVENDSKARKSGQPLVANPRKDSGTKRQKKDTKFGYGGKKRFAKSGDAVSSGDLRAFSSRRMKGTSSKSKRLGKSRRSKVP